MLWLVKPSSIFTFLVVSIVNSGRFCYWEHVRPLLPLRNFMKNYLLMKVISEEKTWNKTIIVSLQIWQPNKISTNETITTPTSRADFTTLVVTTTLNKVRNQIETLTQSPIKGIVSYVMNRVIQLSVAWCFVSLHCHCSYNHNNFFNCIHNLHSTINHLHFLPNQELTLQHNQMTLIWVVDGFWGI